MANIKTYTAPVDRLHPSDLGYTANIQLGRRLSAIGGDTAQILKAGGNLDAKTIQNQYAYDAATYDLANPAPSRNTRSGGATGGSLGGSKATPRQEAARGAAALANVLGGPPQQYGDPAPGLSIPPLHHWWDTNPYPSAKSGSQPVVFGGDYSVPPLIEGLGDYNADPLGRPSNRPGGNMQQYGYGTAEGGGDSGDFSTRPEAASFWGWAQSVIGGAADAPTPPAGYDDQVGTY